MREDNLYLEYETPSLQSQEQKDSFIMEDLINAGLEGQDLAELNRCIIFLHATRLS